MANQMAKKIILINIQLLMSSGQLLIPIGYLEVPLPAPCFLNWNKSDPLKFYTMWTCMFPSTQKEPLLWLCWRNTRSCTYGVFFHKKNLLFNYFGQTQRPCVQCNCCMQNSSKRDFPLLFRSSKWRRLLCSTVPAPALHTSCRYARASEAVCCAPASILAY